LALSLPCCIGCLLVARWIHGLWYARWFKRRWPNVQSSGTRQETTKKENQ
jgi:hypothetical protein